jgi:hypothetical protein
MIDRVVAESASEHFASVWLRVKGLPWGADLIEAHASSSMTQGDAA